MEIAYLVCKMRKRFYFLLLAALSVMALDALPVMRTILNKPVYHASSSETRAVTGWRDPTVTATAITHLTLWDIGNPVYPRQGITLSESNWWGYTGYREATVYQNLLIYMDENYLSVMDISNIDIPVRVHHLRIYSIYCLGVYQHYLLLGKQDGTLDVYDLAEPSTLRYVGSFQAQPSVWAIRQSGDKLGVICGNYSNHTASLFGFNEAEETFTELASVTGTGRMSWVGEVAGRLVCEYQQSGIMIYDYASSSPPALLHEMPASADLYQVLGWEDKMVSISQDNHLRVWQLNEQSQPVQSDYYDLSHLGLDQKALFELKGERLLFMVGNLLCLVLDISDSAPSLEPIAKYENGENLNLLAVPSPSDGFFVPSVQGIRALKLDSSGLISENVLLPIPGPTLSLKAWQSTLQVLSGPAGSTRMTSINVEDSAQPHTVSDIELGQCDLLLRKNRYLYAGSSINVGKYSLDISGVPSIERQFRYTVQGFNVYFMDFASLAGAEYGLGIFGSVLFGFYNVLVWWLPDGERGHLILNDRVDKLHAVDRFLYLSGDGIHVFRLTQKIPSIYRSYYKDNHHRGAVCSIMAGQNYLIESYEVSNLISVYDLSNPRNPQLILEILQPHNCRDIAYYEDKLLTANGIHGITVYELPWLASVQAQAWDQEEPENPQDPENPEDPPDPGGGDPVPPVPPLWAFPNPFKSGLNLRFELKLPSNVSIEIFNLRGQKMHSQVLNGLLNGLHTATWDGRDARGQRCPAGVYIVRFTSNRGTFVKRITKAD